MAVDFVRSFEHFRMHVAGPFAEITEKYQFRRLLFDPIDTIESLPANSNQSTQA